MNKAKTNKLEFRKLYDEEFDTAYSIVCDAVNWLLSKNIRQWTVPIPRDIYQTQQNNCQNYALICDSSLAVVLSLVKEISPHWIDKTGNEECWWIQTIAAASAYRGKGLGLEAVQKAKNYLQEEGTEKIFIDCVHGDGFLPEYYRQAGFGILDRKQVKYPTSLFDMVLMACSLVK